MRAVERAYKPGNIPLVEIFVLAAAYFGAGSFGLSLASVNRSATAVWPGTGLSIAALLFFGWRLWPGVFLGAFLVNILTQGGVVTTLGIASGNTLEALMGAWLVQRFAGGSKAFEKTRNIFRFVWLAAMLSTLVSASIGVTSLCLGGFAHWKDFSAIWLTWWLGDMVSAVIIAPLLLLWATKPFPRLAWRPILEAGALLLLVFWIGQTIFLGHAPFHGHNYPLEYLAIPPLLWASFRFGEHGAVSTAFIMSGIALWGTRHNLGPFVGYDQNEALLLLQTFMGTITMTGLVLASILAGRHRAELRLKAQYALSQALADAATLKEATPRIFQALSEPDGWQFGSIWIVDRQKEELVSVEVWHAPGMEVTEFEAVTRQMTFKRGAGLPGRVWDAGKAASVLDVTVDPNFPRAAYAARCGLHGAFCFPLKLGSEVLGVLECFSRESRVPDEHFIEMLEGIGNQLGQFIERRRAEEQERKAHQALAEAEARLRQHAAELDRRVQDKTARLEETVQSLDGFCYSIAHDLRAPLRALGGFSRELSEDYAHALDDVGRSHLQRIKAAAARMDQLILDLLKLGRLNTAELPEQRVDFNQVVRKTLALLGEEIKTRGAEVRLGKPLLAVRANHVMVEQALMNLLANALKFVPPEVTPIVEITTDQRDSKVRLSVRDNGIGIKPEHTNKLFQPFVRLVNGNEFPGTGIGLAIVRKGVERMGGTVGIDSNPGQGSCFWIELPLASEESVSP